MIDRFLCAAIAVISLAALPAGPGQTRVTGSVQPAPLAAHLTGNGSGTLVLRGSLSSTSSVTLRGALSVGHAQGLIWDLIRVPDMRVGGYHQTVLSQTFRFSVPPDSYEDLTVGGVDVRRFHWNTPPANTVISVSQQLKLHIQSHLTRLKKTQPYPIGTVSDNVQPYLAKDSSLQLTRAQRSYVRWLVRKKTTEQGVVRKVANWIASHVRYDPSMSGGPYDASWVMTNRRATCQGYTSLMAGMLRALGIPTQVVYGIVSKRPVYMPTNRGTQVIKWSSAGPHDWLNVYFPATGWVSFDPQMEKFFVDSRHYALLTEVDARNPVIGQWGAYSVKNQSVTGRPLSNGTYEMVPGDGTAHMTIRLHDSSQVHVASLVHDVHTVTLFSR